MNLHSGTPFWLVKNGIATPRPPLRTSERCDVAVIGAGVTGALVADAWTSAGLDIVVLERRESGIGSTSASTALIQYEIDLELIALREKLGASHVDAQHAVCATGYDLPDFLPLGRVTLHSTYALATERLTHFGPWDDRCLVWESARPYAYMRTTDDRRIIIGGEDVPFRDAAWRDRLLPTKTKKLEGRLRHLVPTLETETAFEWAGTFAESPDGLPYIGRDARYPGMLFALGYGGNGITFSVIAAELITAECQGRAAPDADVFRMDR